MSPENAHKLIRIYMGGLILGVNTLYTLSCFLKQFALVDKRLIKFSLTIKSCFVYICGYIPSFFSGHSLTLPNNKRTVMLNDHCTNNVEQL